MTLIDLERSERICTASRRFARRATIGSCQVYWLTCLQIVYTLYFLPTARLHDHWFPFSFCCDIFYLKSCAVNLAGYSPAFWLSVCTLIYTARRYASAVLAVEIHNSWVEALDHHADSLEEKLVFQWFAKLLSLALLLILIIILTDSTLRSKL